MLRCFFLFTFCDHAPSKFYVGPYVQILKINPSKKDIDSFMASDFKLFGYDPHQKIEMKMAV